MKSKSQPSDISGRNCYIFFAPSIGNIGGGQLYLSAKVKWLESLGWDVMVYFTDKQTVQLPNLKKFEKSFLPDLTIRFSSYPNNEREIICRKMLSGYGVSDRVVIESYSFESALWGEYMAKMCAGKHICYIIGERIVDKDISGSMKSFLRFKLNQHLLYGITTTTIPSILPDADGCSTLLKAEGCSQFSAPLIQDQRMKSVPDDGFTILSVGRLEKPYIKILFEEVGKFSDKISIPVNFVVIGDTSQNGLKKKLFSILKSYPNIRMSFWGYTFPVPRQLYERADVFVGCAGSANLAYKERVPTITVDAVDNKAIGILGETTENRLYRNSHEVPVDISELLMLVFEERKERREYRKNLSPIVEDVDFSHHLDIIVAEFDGRYYPVEKVRNAGCIDLIYTLLNKSIGKDMTLRLKDVMHIFKA